MDRKELLEDLLLMLDQAADQMGRAQRSSAAGEHGIDGLDRRVDAAYAEVVGLRNLVRDTLMNYLATRPPGPRKLPIV